MAQAGFEEAQTAFMHLDGSSFVGQVRRFGPVGPAYEVVGCKPSGDLVITVIESGERLDYPLVDLLADPLAETVP